MIHTKINQRILLKIDELMNIFWYLFLKCFQKFIISEVLGRYKLLSLCWSTCPSIHKKLGESQIASHKSVNVVRFSMDSIKSITLHHHNKAFIYSIFLGLQLKGSYVLDPLSSRSLRTPLLYGLPQIHMQHLPLPLTTKILHTPFFYSTPKMNIPNLPLPHSPKLPDIPLFYVIRKNYAPSLLHPSP